MTAKRGILAFLIGALASLSAAAQEADVEPERLRQAMQRYFEDRLRSELALTDEQVGQVIPPLRELERKRHGVKRERTQTVRKLRQGMVRGATDAELDRWLKQLDELDRQSQEATRATLARIDGDLTARQRVQLRFFMQSFQQELRERVRGRATDRPVPRRGASRPGGRRFN